MAREKSMPTRSSVKPSSKECCGPHCMPPLSPLAYVVMLFLPYISSVLGNAVTLRQIKYADEFQQTYGKPLQPLPDTAIFQNVELPSFASRLAMRDWVNVLAGFWCALMFLLWLFRRNYSVFATFLFTQTFLVPVLAVSQWMTIVPDSDPQCLASIDVPEGDDWIWYRVSLIQCGDMMWSSAIVQSVMFSILGFSGFKSRCVHVLGALTSAVMIIIISILAWMALYQYACDILLSVCVSMVVCTHPFMRFGGRILFITTCVDDRVRMEESEHLMKNLDQEFAIELNSDEDV